MSTVVPDNAHTSSGLKEVGRHFHHLWAHVLSGIRLEGVVEGAGSST